MKSFKKINVGTTLYTIKAMRNPEDGDGFVLGNVVTSDECVSSKFGDTRLFFRHQWIEDDIVMRPEWSEAYFDDCYCNLPEMIEKYEKEKRI